MKTSPVPHPRRSWPGGADARRLRAFTLLELLTVMAIIGVLAAISVPIIGKFKPNYTASAARQLLDDISRARQLAISQRTTVYMVFVPTNVAVDAAYRNNTPWFYANPARSTNIFEKQGVGYNFVSLRSLGDQPGRPTIKYLTQWRSLPEGAFIPAWKFAPYLASQPVMTLTNAGLVQSNIFGFHRTNSIPFPNEDAPFYRVAQPYVTVPYIAFDYMGRLTTGADEIIPLAKGSVGVPRGADRKAIEGPLSYTEQPMGNATNTFNLVYINWLTGRARGVQPEIQ